MSFKTANLLLIVIHLICLLSVFLLWIVPLLFSLGFVMLTSSTVAKASHNYLLMCTTSRNCADRIQGCKENSSHLWCEPDHLVPLFIWTWWICKTLKHWKDNSAAHKQAEEVCCIKEMIGRWINCTQSTRSETWCILRMTIVQYSSTSMAVT